MDQICSFECIWFDDVQNTTHRLILRYFQNKSVEISELDIELKIFLKRTVVPTVNYENLCVGSKITVFGKNIEIMSLMDERTRSILSSRIFRITLMYTHSLEGTTGTAQLSDFLTRANDLGLKIQRIKSGRRESMSGSLLSFTSTTPNNLQETIASLQADSCVFLFSSDFGDNIEDLFKQMDATWCLTSSEGYCTCCVIKPHIFSKGSRSVGQILLDIVSRRLPITFIQLTTMNLSMPIAKEMFGCYRGVISAYSSWLDEYCSGTCLCLGLKSNSENIVNALRDECGPMNPTIGRIIRPRSIRAVFGVKSVAMNAVHCTDLPEDGEMECDYLFNGLS